MPDAGHPIGRRDTRSAASSCRCSTTASTCGSRRTRSGRQCCCPARSRRSRTRSPDRSARPTRRPAASR
ncbi:hypothetical protein EEJ42_09475 [Streptomyces botrytidirepellens]|uniref:Uncharacterized protein n=1 Tax=Streptomyces botrytidirepellens TaxID=2486417 RepID=A0A3M8WPS4_9ACTN|nr:hypothetical protein EEJ42_09475 [Streptomyces botrytidirepellens]